MITRLLAALLAISLTSAAHAQSMRSFPPLPTGQLSGLTATRVLVAASASSATGYSTFTCDASGNLVATSFTGTGSGITGVSGTLSGLTATRLLVATGAAAATGYAGLTADASGNLTATSFNGSGAGLTSVPGALSGLTATRLLVASSATAATGYATLTADADGNLTATSFIRGDGAFSPITIYQNTADSTAITADSATAFSLTKTVASGQLNTASRKLWIHLSGVYSSAASAGTNTLTLKVGAVNILTDSGMALTALQTNAKWEADIIVRVSTAGASGKFEGSAKTVYNVSGAASVATSGGTVGESSAVDLTGAPAISILNTFSATGNSITIQDMHIQILN